jgi:hypothetical protein
MEPMAQQENARIGRQIGSAVLEWETTSFSPRAILLAKKGNSQTGKERRRDDVEKVRFWMRQQFPDSSILR